MTEPVRPRPVTPAMAPAPSDLHGRPSASELLESVREWLERDVLTQTSGRLQFHTRVAINVMAMVERELAQGAEQRVRHDIRLVSFGAADDAELASMIRSGALDDRYDELRAALAEAVRDKVAVANPKYLER